MEVSPSCKISLNGAASIQVFNSQMSVHCAVRQRDNDRLVSSMNVLGNPKCFSGDDFVSMADGEKKLLSELRPGDRVLVMNSLKQIEEDEVIMMLDSQPKRPGSLVSPSFNRSSLFSFASSSVLLH